MIVVINPLKNLKPGQMLELIVVLDMPIYLHGVIMVMNNLFDLLYSNGQVLLLLRHFGLTYFSHNHHILILHGQVLL